MAYFRISKIPTAGMVADELIKPLDNVKSARIFSYTKFITNGSVGCATRLLSSCV